VRVAAFAAAALLVVAARADDDPDAARRAAVAKLGRLAWRPPEGPIEFCDLDGGNVVVSDSRKVEWLRWLPDGRRVVATGYDRVYVVDAATGKSVDLTADAKYGERFLSDRPLLSPDGRRLVTWRSLAPSKRTPTRFGAGTVNEEVAGYAVIDLDTGARREIGPVRVPMNWWDAPAAAWSDDGKNLYAAVGRETQTLSRFTADGVRLGDVAQVPDGRVDFVLVRGERVVYAVHAGRQLNVLQVGGGKPSLSCAGEGRPVRCTGLAWDDDGALLVDVDFGLRRERRRVPEGGAPELLASLALPQRASAADGTWSVVAELAEDGGTSLRRVGGAGEAPIGPGTWPLRVAQDVVVYWRPTKPPVAWTREMRRFFDPAELRAWFPKDGSSIRLMPTPVAAWCWDVFAPPPVSRAR
jgi:hypothetical protein